MDPLRYLAHLKPDSPKFLEIRERLYDELYELVDRGKISGKVVRSIIDSRIYDSPGRLAILLLLSKD